MNRISRLTVLLVAVPLILLLASGCNKTSSTGSTPDQPEDLRTPAQLTAEEQSIVNNTNEFAFRLFRDVCSRQPVDKNIFLSPISASYALSLTATGANGDTRDSILHALALDGMTMEQVNEAYHDLAHILMNADSEVAFTIANSFWSRLGKEIRQEYIDDAREYYDARVQEIDISQPWAADTINQWVKDNTNNKIQSIVEPPLDFAALLNAIYFKGNWRYPFDTASTRERPFRLADGSVKPWDIMFMSAEDIIVDTSGAEQLNPDVKVFQNADLAMINLPYGQEGFEMLVVVPDNQTTVDDFISDLDLQEFSGWIDQLHVDRFFLSMPRMKFSFDVSLNQPLQALGMRIAFDPGRCDFGRMFVDGVGWIDQVKQKSFVQVDEKGTEAAVVTAVSMADSVPPVIDATRPFVFMIRENQSGAIVFMAKIAEPVWED